MAIACLVCIAAPVALGAGQIANNPRFSPIDEAAHYDYVNRLAEGSIPRQGDRFLPSTLRTVACRGTVIDHPRLPSCDARRLPYRLFPGGASQYEAQQPPTYYALTVPLRWIIQHVLRVPNQLDATRAAGIVWLIAGLLLCWAAGRVMDIDAFPLGAALLLLAAAPAVVYQSGYVTNDATAIPAAGLVALVSALAYTRNGPKLPIALFAAGFFAAASKTTNLFAVVVLSAMFACAAIAQRAGTERWTATVHRWWRNGGLLLTGGVTAAVLWLVVHRARALIDLRDEPAFGVLRGSPITPGLIGREAVNLLQPLTGSVLSADTLDHDVQAPLFAALRLLLIAAGVGGLFVSPRGWQHVLGLITVPALYLGGLLFGVSQVLSYRIDPALASRHAMSLAPLLILVLAASVVGKWAARAVALFALALFGTTLVVMVT
jgi:hypothetical protein